MVRRVGSWNGRWAGQVQAVTSSSWSVGVLGLSLAVLGLLEVSIRVATGHFDVDSALALELLVLASALPLATMDAAPAALFACSASTLSLTGFHLLSAAAATAVLIALFRLGRQPRGLFQLIAIVLASPFLILALTELSPSSSEAATLTIVLAALAPAAAIGGIAVQARSLAEENREASQVIADTLVGHVKRGERTRIARELHDVVAHHISMIAVQAEVARLAVPGLPEGGARRLSAIGDSAREALVEMRQLLCVLRDDAGVEFVNRSPQPGLDQVIELVDDARKASGRPTRLIFRGVPIPVDSNVELVAYRIVQEALTNSRRHAPGAAVDVELIYADASLRLRVRDNGPGPLVSVVPGGHGVSGMHERAAVVGGSVRTGHATGGGYLVEALLPAKIEEPV